MGILGLLRNIAGGRQEENELWNQPQTADEIDDILSRTSRPQVIYKHSYSCAVSLFAKSSLESRLEPLAEQADLHLVDVIAQRDLSKKIADKTGIRHESPQVMVMYKGTPYWSASHSGVRLNDLKATLNELRSSANTD